VSTNQNPKKDSAPSNSTAPKKGASGSRKRKRRRSGTKKGSGQQKKSIEIDQEAVLRANERFDRIPRAMGLPDNL